MRRAVKPMPESKKGISMQKLVLGMFLGLVVSIGWINGAVAEDPIKAEFIPKLVVRGEATLNVPADQMRLNVGVITNADTADTALAENNTIMKRVEETMKKTGLGENEYQTGQFQIQPRWSQPPNKRTEYWKPFIVGYTVTNRLKIKTTKINLAGDLIASASGAGANTIDTILFDLSEPRRYRAKAIERATANAMVDARSLAKAASTKLLRVLKMRLDNAYAKPLRMRRDRFAQESGIAMAAPAPVIKSGDVTVRASVVIVYEIAQIE